jgi:hypothetical protein
MFWKKKAEPLPIRSDEFELIFKKLTALVAEIETLSLKLRNLDTEMRSVRSKVNMHINKEGNSDESQNNDSGFINPFA